MFQGAPFPDELAALDPDSLVYPPLSDMSDMPEMPDMPDTPDSEAPDSEAP
jgi:hypothetical protein